MNGRFREWISRAGQTIRPSRSDQDIARELQMHLEIAEDELRRQGMPQEEAARVARVQLGRSTQAMEAIRESRGIPGIDAFWLDVKLGLRMLRKHWGLTAVGGLAMAFSMTLGASVFSYVQSRTGTSLPFEEGDRVVILQRWNPGTRTAEGSSAEDLERWRDGLRSVTDLGAFRITEQNLAIPSGIAGPVAIAEMSASAFAIARVQPMLGRYLLPEDERPGANPVMVIGSDVWESRFAADPGVIGKPVRLDGQVFTVAGVMPGSFGFPVNHQYWVPLQNSTVTQGRSDLTVFGRLARGVPITTAQAEAASLGLSAVPGAGGMDQLRARVVPYVEGITGGRNPWLTRLVPVLGILLLLPPCLNIAALIYARTVARQGEFAARAALGASRRRIVAQVFIETLLLTSGSAALAMALSPKAAYVLGAMLAVGQQPFWVSFDVSYLTFLFSGGLAVLAALIAGAFPALRATGRWKVDGLHLLNRSTAPRLGKTWTAIVAAQVALSVAVVPLVAEATWNAMRPVILGPGFNASLFLTGRLALDRQTDSSAARFASLRDELVRKLRSEPGVSAVSVSEAVPMEERSVFVETGADKVSSQRKEASINRVDATFFDALGARFLAGSRELRQGMAVVNQGFIDRVLPGKSALGQQIRLFGRGVNSRVLGQYEIAGVVADIFPAPGTPAVYVPLAGAEDDSRTGMHQIRFMIRSDRGIQANSTARVREIADALDPRLRVDDFQTLDEVYRGSKMADYVLGLGLAMIALCVVLFSVTGIYTLMSFSVEHRRREIGIRSALGASPARLAFGAFGRVLTPVGISAVLGGLAAIAADYFFGPVILEGGARLRWLLPAGELFIVLIAVAVLIGPVRRALRVDPAEALHDS